VLQGVVEEIRPFASYRTLAVRMGDAESDIPLFLTHITASALDDLDIRVGSAVHLVFKTRSIEVLAQNPPREAQLRT
jgi:ABC-type molybdate transport system ATPase subunit